MNVQEAIEAAKNIMVAAGLVVVYRGVPTHCIENLGKDEGKYSAKYHVIITGPEYENNTLVHEACHALQMPDKGKNPEYMNNYQSYMNDPQEKEAFFVAAMFEYGIKVEKGDLERWNMGKPKGSLKKRIEDMINKKYRR